MMLKKRVYSRKLYQVRLANVLTETSPSRHSTPQWWTKSTYSIDKAMDTQLIQKMFLNGVVKRLQMTISVTCFYCLTKPWLQDPQAPSPSTKSTMTQVSGRCITKFQRLEEQSISLKAIFDSRSPQMKRYSSTSLTRKLSCQYLKM